jgi:Beta-lactamase
VLEPFRMHSSSYVWNATYEAHAAEPHDTNGRLLNRKRPTDIDAARYGAAGLLHTTPTDYANFLIEVMNPRDADPFRLQPKTTAEMVRPHVKGGDSPLSSRGLGWEVVQAPEDNYLVHGGDNDGFHAFVAASLKQRTGYIVMTNGDGGGELIKKLIIGETPLNRLLRG